MPIIVLIICVIAAVIGIGLIFDIFNIDPSHTKKIAIDKKSVQDIEATLKDSNSKRTLSKTIGYYQGKKDFFVIEEANNARAILNETGRAGEWTRTMMSCVICSGIGAFIGFLCDRNILLIIVLGAGCFMIPLWRLKLYRNKYRKYLAAQLESCTSLITTSYIRNGDICLAVQENINELSPIVKPYFQDFLTECKVNVSIKNCVRNLRDKINDNIFKEWCEILLRTLDNSEMREALIPIAQKYSEVRIVQDEVDLETHQAIIEYIVMMIMDIACYPMVWLLNKEWFAYYSTIPGKCVVAFTFIVLLYSIFKLIDVMQPVEYKR